MDLFSAINKRKSCRDYTGQSFDQKQLGAIVNFIEGAMSLEPDAPLKWRFAKEMKGPFKVDAPHYLIISGQGNLGEAVNAGFIFQQLMLWLNLNGIGSVWLGGPRDVEQNLTGNDIIAIAFGEPKEIIHRSESEFRRKPISEITNNPDDPCIQAVHLAPSGMNLQPWYLEEVDNKVLLYRKILNPVVSLMYKLTEVDLGIALCHYALACQQIGKPFVFQRRDERGNKKGFHLFGELL